MMSSVQRFCTMTPNESRSPRGNTTSFTSQRAASLSLLPATARVGASTSPSKRRATRRLEASGEDVRRNQSDSSFGGRSARVRAPYHAQPA